MIYNVIVTKLDYIGKYSKTRSHLWLSTYMLTFNSQVGKFCYIQSRTCMDTVSNKSTYQPQSISPLHQADSNCTKFLYGKVKI